MQHSPTATAKKLLLLSYAPPPQYSAKPIDYKNSRFILKYEVWAQVVSHSKIEKNKQQLAEVLESRNTAF